MRFQPHHQAYCRLTWQAMAESLRRICTNRRAKHCRAYEMTEDDLSWMRGKISHFWREENHTPAPPCPDNSFKAQIAWIDQLFQLGYQGRYR